MPELINPQSRVPEMDLPLVGGGRFDIHEMTPDKFTLVIAYRGLHCPKCKAQLQAVDPMVEGLKSRGYEIVAVSMDSEARARKAKVEWDIKNIPIAYDMGLLMAKSWAYLFLISAPIATSPNFFPNRASSSSNPMVRSTLNIFKIRPLAVRPWTMSSADWNLSLSTIIPQEGRASPKPLRLVLLNRASHKSECAAE